MAERTRRAERAEQLLDIALRLIAQDGYEAASMSAIALAAGITKPVIYRIYPSRQALLLALYRREQRRIDVALDLIVPAASTLSPDRLPLEVLRDGLAGILAAASEHPLTWQLALYPSEGTPAAFRALVRRRRDGFVKRARALVEWGLPYLDVPAPPDAEIVATMLVIWAEEHARILLEDPRVSAGELIASAVALLSALPWRARPAAQPASAVSTAASASASPPSEPGGASSSTEGIRELSHAPRTTAAPPSSSSEGAVPAAS